MSRFAIVLACLSLAQLGVACSGSSSSSSSDAGGEASGGASSAGKTSGGSKSGGAANNGGVSAGGTSAGGASAGSPATGGTPNWEEWGACEVAEDCTVIPINSCCGCAPTGVNVMYEEEGRASNAGFNASACGPLGCANFPCPPDSMVACEMGRCVPKPGCSERDELSCEADEKCEKYQARLCTSPGEFAYFACGKPKGACDDALTCFVSPAAQQVLFPDSCVPDGYTQACPSQCQ